jgi:hypothetical protein
MTVALLPAQHPYEWLTDVICVRADVLITSGFVSLELWRKWSRTIGVLQKGGNGRTSLIAFDKLPTTYRTQIITRWGDPQPVAHPLLQHFTADAAVREFFAAFQLPDATYLPLQHQATYTANALVLRAASSLYQERKAMRQRMGGSTRGVWATVVADVASFNKVLLPNYQMQHNLPKSERKLQDKLKNFQRQGLASLISEKFGNANAQKVTPLMIKLWNDMFSTQKHKPTYYDIAAKYNDFLSGNISIVNSDTAEIYDRTDADAFRPISEGSVYNYLSSWEQRVVSHKVRSGDRQKYRQQNIPFHKLLDPGYSFSMLSIDDRQPPFEYAQGKRMWFYNGIDLNSQAFICAVHGETKEGIILDFYRQLVRNCHEWRLPIPHELECESSLNSSFRETILAPGNLFSAVRIEANNARGKRIEAYYRPLRYQVEKEREGWLARPFALAEANQISSVTKKYVHKDQLVSDCYADFEKWNNTLHPNQDKYPGQTRWEVCISNVHPDARPINWYAILPYLGYRTTATVKAGRVTCHYQHRVFGINGEVATGEKLINILKKIEGKPVDIYWLDGSEGQWLKGIVYHNGRMICEVMDDLAYNRSELERTPEDDARRQLMSKYVMTVEGFINTGKAKIETLHIEQETPTHQPTHVFSFARPATIERTFESTADDLINPTILAQPEEDDNDTSDYIFSINTKDRF